MPGETLYAGGLVRLFGREFTGLVLGANPPLATKASGIPLRDQLDKATDPRLARVYGFSYQGNYYKLSDPTILLVHGEGAEVPAGNEAVCLDVLGVEFKSETFAAHVRMWEQDEVDFSVRIDITTGWLQDILVTPEISDAGNVTGGDAAEMSGRGQMVGRGQLVGRGQMVGRANKG